MKPGTHVEVRARFEERWSRGFAVEAIDHVDGEERFTVRRRSDGSVLPVAFARDDLREERRRSTWWI